MSTTGKLLPIGKLLLPLLAAGFAGGAAATELPNYRYAELAYSTGEVDIGVDNLGDVDIDQDGFELEGSFSFLDDRLWVYGSYSDVSGDEAGVDFDIETGTVGVGAIIPLADAATADFSVLYRTDELSALGLSDDVDGIGIAAGVRGNLNEIVELFGRIGYLAQDYEGALLLDLGGVVNINELFGITISYELLSADDDGVDLDLGQLQVGARLKF